VFTLIAIIACTGSPEDALTTSFVSADGLYNVDVVPDLNPPTVGETVVAVTTDPPADALDVWPWMPNHGHGTSVEPTVEQLELGVHEASWEYGMPGLWEVTFTLSGEAGEDELVVTYEVQ
jgi:hypothetical protein